MSEWSLSAKRIFRDWRRKTIVAVRLFTGPLTLEHRATGWLTPNFHHAWQHVLLHTCARYDLLCPAYVLMPDHKHVFLLGLADRTSDQRTAVEFLRKHLRPHLAPADWQRQSHDHVLREHERKLDAFPNVAGYIFDNPVRAGLAPSRDAWPFSGCCVPGYPDLNVRRVDYWDLFWRIYNRLVNVR